MATDTYVLLILGRTWMDMERGYIMFHTPMKCIPDGTRNHAVPLSCLWPRINTGFARGKHVHIYSMKNMPPILIKEHQKSRHIFLLLMKENKNKMPKRNNKKTAASRKSKQKRGRTPHKKSTSKANVLTYLSLVWQIGMLEERYGIEENDATNIPRLYKSGTVFMLQ